MKNWLLYLLPTASLFSEVHYNVIVDPYLTPYVGAEDLLSTYRGLEALEEWLIKPPETPRRSFLKDIERLADLVLIWEPINGLTTVAQHEVFGHGFRVRTTPHTHVKKYVFGTPLPYGDGGGATHYSIQLDKVTVYEELAIESGGVEATAIFANRLKLHWLQRGTIDPRQSTLYIYTQQDLTLYTSISTEHSEEGNDISGYVRLLNKTYPKGHLSVTQLQDQTLVNLLDPFTYYAIYDWFYYIFTGKQGPMPMIPIGPYRYLPGARLGLTPFGPEYYLENYLVKNEKPIYFYLRYGKYAQESYWGFGIEHAYLWTIDSTPWGLRLDFWRQPHAAFRNTHYALVDVFENDQQFTSQPHNPHFGIALSVIGHKKLWSSGSLFFQIGGKTIGFLPGEPLQPAVIARIGLTIW